GGRGAGGPAMSFAETVLANAWVPGGAGACAAGLFDPAGVKRLALGGELPAARTFLKPPPPADERDWRDPRVGWGLVLPNRHGLTDEQLATADDAPEPIRELVRRRDNAPVFRVHPDPARA